MAGAAGGNGLHTLRQWLQAFGVPPEHYTAGAAASAKVTYGPVNATLCAALCERYGIDTNASGGDAKAGGSADPLLADRVHVYRELLVAAATTPAAHFALDAPAAVVASPGRDRLFQGHTDLPGLGGFTVDAATREEIVVVVQANARGAVTLTNTAANEFPAIDFPMSDVWDVAKSVSPPSAGPLTATAIWKPTQWESYVKGALAFLLCPRFDAHQHVLHALTTTASAANTTATATTSTTSSSVISSNSKSESASSPPFRGLAMFVSSAGLLRLPSNGGMSSSAALTGAFAKAIDKVFALNLTLPQLAQTDFGEYFLNKSAGAADKMAQLNAARGKVVITGSFPERVLECLTFPSTRVGVVMADCPTPRLSLTATAREYLSAQTSASAAVDAAIVHDKPPPSASSAAAGGASRRYSDAHVSAILGWATDTMTRFASLAYVVGVRTLVAALKTGATATATTATQTADKMALTPIECQWLLDALHGRTPSTGSAASAAASSTAQPSAAPTAAAPAPLGAAAASASSAQQPLLRELCTGGALELQDKSLFGWAARHARYALLYKALRLVPEQTDYKAPNASAAAPPLTLHLRKAVLYGVSETERGVAYQKELDAISSAVSNSPKRTAAATAATAAGASSAAAAAPITSLLHLVRLSHDADRAFVDYRYLQPNATTATAAATTPASATTAAALTASSFVARAWASDARASCSDASLAQWCSASAELIACVGGFERSLPEMDDMADRVHREFAGHAALRVSAAGLGGRVCVHADVDILDRVVAFLQAWGWAVRRLQPSAPTQLLAF